MKIKDMFAKKIDREIQGVIIVGQGEDANVSQELEEYVVTRELQKHFADFYSAYKKGIVGTTPKMGVWISGFFGSGKSHFLKILSYLLENRQVGDRKAMDYFVEDMLAVRENVMRTHHATVDDAIINRVLRFGTADIREDYLTTIRETAAEYVGGIFRILREHEYDPALMRLHVLGGGGCLVRNFGAYDAGRVTIYEDICATAKGYEFLCEQALRRGVGG